MTRQSMLCTRCGALASLAGEPYVCSRCAVLLPEVERPVVARAPIAPEARSLRESGWSDSEPSLPFAGILGCVASGLLLLGAAAALAREHNGDLRLPEFLVALLAAIGVGFAIFAILGGRAGTIGNGVTQIVHAVLFGLAAFAGAAAGPFVVLMCVALAAVSATSAVISLTRG